MKNPWPCHPFFWLWLPILWMAGQLFVEMTVDPDIILHYHRENAPIEIIQFFMLAAVFIFSCRLLLRMDRKQSLWLTFWIAAAALGSFYVAAEEISWGQWLFGWDTPETWDNKNYQGETNLHNTSKWLNQKPRLLLEIGVIAGGILIPLLRRFKPSWLPARFEIIYPPTILAVTAGIYTAAKFSHKLSKIYLDTKIFQRASEVEELYLFYFVLLYIVILSHRILTAQGKKDAA